MPAALERADQEARTLVAAAASLFVLGGGSTWRSVLQRVKRVYADAGLIMAVVMGPSDPFYDAAMRFLDEAQRTGVKIVVSRLTLMEAVDVLRRRAKMRHKCRNESEEEREKADAAADAGVAGLVYFIKSRRALRLVEILEEASTVTLDFGHLLEKMLEHRGRTPAARKGNTYRHEAIGPVDLIHIVLAHLAGVQAICTTDRALAQIKDDSTYGGVEIITLQPRPAPAKRRRRSRRR